MRDFLAERDPSHNPHFQRCWVDDPIGPPDFQHGLPHGPGEQAQAGESLRLKIAAEVRNWRRSRHQAGVLKSQAGIRAWRAA